MRSLVMAGGRPIPVPYGLVESFVELFGNSVSLQTDLHAGLRVEVLTGPFASLVSMIDRLDGEGRVRALLRLLNGETPAAMDRDGLQPVT